MNTPAPMPDSAFPLQLDALVAQREFVRRLAHSLLRDDAAADDVAQDVMLRALERPRRDVHSLRGFLATLTRRRASNLRRSESRRAEHESRTARAAAFDEADARRSLETAQEVAAEVLALDEPYRGVLLLLYLQGESPAAIAERHGTTPATVRSQHKRALELLRERLDRRHGGKRETWGTAVAGIIARPDPALPSLASVVAGCVLLCALGFYVYWSQRTPRPPTGDAALKAAVAAPDAQFAPAALSAEKLASAAAPAPAVRAAVGASDAFDPAGRSIPELLDLAAAAQSVLRERLLTVPTEIAARATPIPSGVSGGIARILERTAFGDSDANVIGIRGGGAYFSFTRDSHSYNREPQLQLQQGAFSSGFAGNDVGLVVDFGSVSLDELALGRARLDAASLDAWELLAREVDVHEPGSRSALKDELRARYVGGPRARVGRTYVVRSIVDRSRDVLAAFHVLAADEYGVVFAWRLLRDRPVIDPVADEWPEVWAPTPSAIPDWLTRLSTDELIGGVRRLALHARAMLLAVPEAPSHVEPTDTATARLLRGYTFGWLLPQFHDGANYSFATRSHDWGKEADIMLDQTWMLDSGGYGGSEGFVVDLGPQSLASLALDAGSPPDSSSALAQQAWKELWELRAQQPTDADPRPRALSLADRERMSALRIDRARAVVGHSYLLRSILSGKHDVLVAFEVTALDEYGCTLRWRMLRRE